MLAAGHGTALLYVYVPLAEVDRQCIIAEKVEAQKPIHAACGGKRVAKHGKVFSFLVQGDNRVQLDQRQEFDAAAGRHLQAFRFEGGIVSNRDQQGRIYQTGRRTRVYRHFHNGNA